MARASLLFIVAATASSASAFNANRPSTALATCISNSAVRCDFMRTGQRVGVMSLNMADDKKAVQVTGEELESMLQEWDQPLVVDAYATW
jgi:hypothetical protein